MTQQSEPTMQIKEEKQPSPLPEHSSAGADEGKDTCTYSRDQLLRIFAIAKDQTTKPVKASTAKASNTSTASSPTTAPSAAPSDSKGSSLMDTPDLTLPPTLFSTGALDREPKDSSSGSDTNSSHKKGSSFDSNKSQKKRSDSPIRVEPSSQCSESKDSASDTSNGQDQASSEQNAFDWLEETWSDPQKVWCKQASWDDLYGFENGAFGSGLFGSSAFADCEEFESNPFGSGAVGNGMVPGTLPFMPGMNGMFPFSDPSALQNLQASLNNLQKLTKKAKSKPATVKNTAAEAVFGGGVNQDCGHKEVCECGNILNPAFIFCDQCGKKRDQHQTCGGCGNVLLLDANFCDQCGLKQVPDAQVPAKADAKSKAAMKKDTKVANKQNQKVSIKADVKLDVTTLMLRNIPKCTQDQLFGHLENIGFKGMIDFLYLPVDFSNERNFGYAFCNFRTIEAANNFKDMFDGIEMGKCFPEDFGCEDQAEPQESDSDSSSPSNTERVRVRKAKRSSNRGEVCKVLPAAVQGWEANMQKLCNSHSVQRIGGPDHWHPLFLDSEGNKINVADRYKPAMPSKTQLNPKAVEFVPQTFNAEETLLSQSDLDAHPSTRGGFSLHAATN